MAASLAGDGWSVGYRCPQCGAPATLDEADRLFRCPFCRVRVLFAPQDTFQYYLAPGESSGGGTFFVPYWRFRGTLLSCEGLEVRARYIDGTLLAARCEGLPASLGVRPHALPLRFVTPDVGGPFLPVAQGRKEAVEEMESRFAAATGMGSDGPVRLRAFAGDMASLLYAPFVPDGDAIRDGVTGSVVSAHGGLSLRDSGSRAEESVTGVRFIGAVCPDCGWNLSGERDSEVVLCENCQSAWAVEAGKFVKVPFAVAGTGPGRSTFLPFWTIPVAAPEWNLRTYADLVRFANLPRAVEKAWEEKPLHFHVPAFRVRGDLFLRIAKGMTIAQPASESVSAMPKGLFYPVTLAAAEVREVLKILVADAAMAKKRVFPLLDRISVEAGSPFLTYMPFAAEGQELVSDHACFAVSLNALKYGRNL